MKEATSSFDIVIDESVDSSITQSLVSHGFNVWEVASRAPSIKDSEVLSIAHDLGALLITEGLIYKAHNCLPTNPLHYFLPT